MASESAHSLVFSAQLEHAMQDSAAKAAVAGTAATAAATAAEPSQQPHCRLMKSRTRKTYYVNPNSLSPDLDVRVEVRVLEEGEHRPYDHYGLLDMSYFGSAELLLQKQIDSPCKFDVFALDRLVEQPVYHFGMFLFERCGFFKRDVGLNIDPVICGWLLQRIAGLYHYRNPYHNQLHAIDVTQAFYVMIQQPGILKKFHLNQLEVFTTLLAALCHDVDHPGCTAKYLCLFKHQNFFKAYNDRFCQPSAEPEKRIQFTLENHHTRMGCSLLLQSGLIEALGLTPVQRAATVRLMSDLINATDMDRHKSLVEKFQADLLRAEEAKHAERWASDEVGRNHTKTVKMDLLELIIKCADIGNPFRDWPICSAWAELVCQEFYRQGDLEELCKKHFMSAEELAQLPAFTGSLKRTAQVAAIQVGFINSFVLPLIQVYTNVEATASSKIIQHTVELNLNLWTMLDNINQQKILNYLGPAQTAISAEQLQAVLNKFLSEQKITLTVRSVK